MKREIKGNRDQIYRSKEFVSPHGASSEASGEREERVGGIEEIGHQAREGEG